MSYGQFLEALAEAHRTPDEAQGRIYGILYGRVTDVDQKLGRVRARVGAQADNESTDWLDPAWPGNIEAWPNPGDSCYVAFVDGDPNRGVCLGWHPTSKTTGRATNAMVLGTTMVGLFNFMVDQFNQLRTDFNTLVTTLSAHTHTGVSIGSGTSGTSTAFATSSTTALAANKGQASDGSTVSNQTSSVRVLSGRIKVK